jgi:diadenylate cyclase
MDYIIEIVSNIRIMDIIDISIVAYVFYKFLSLIKETRAEQLIKGIILLLVMLKLSEWSKLYMINYILKNTMTIGMVALIIVFQPELRRALEYLGRSKFFSRHDKDETIQNVEEIVDSVLNLAKTRTGALIVIENNTGLNEIITTGTKIDSLISKELIWNIFYPKSPLHDGAMIIRRNRIVSAGCLLPLSENLSISKELGTRHRAAIGMVENSDALVLVVSEETGTISIAHGGSLKRNMNRENLTNRILNILKESEQEGINLRRWWLK